MMVTAILGQAGAQFTCVTGKNVYWYKQFTCFTGTNAIPGQAGAQFACFTGTKVHWYKSLLVQTVYLLYWYKRTNTDAEGKQLGV